MKNIFFSDQTVEVACKVIMNSKSDMIKFWLSGKGK